MPNNFVFCCVLLNLMTYVCFVFEENLEIPTGGSQRSSSSASKKLRFKVNSQVVDFKESAPERVASQAYAYHVVQSALRSSASQCSFFELVAKNGQATLSALVAIDHDFPRTLPLFAININWKHDDRNYLNDEAVRVCMSSMMIICDCVFWRRRRKFVIFVVVVVVVVVFQKDMEREINVYDAYDYLKELCGPSHEAEFILCKQVNHLLVCFDIYLESESYYLNDYEYQRSKLFSASIRGRDRRRPYAYSSLMDAFVQRMQFTKTN